MLVGCNWETKTQSDDLERKGQGQNRPERRPISDAGRGKTELHGNLILRCPEATWNEPCAPSV